MSAGDIKKAEIVPWLVANAARVGSGEPLVTTLPDAIGWMRSCWEYGEDYLPLTLVHDLGLVLLRGREFRFASSDQLGRWSPDERAVRLAYEDRVIGRWALDTSITEAHIAIAGMPPAKKNSAVAHAIMLALGRALRGQSALPRGNPAHLRSAVADVLSKAPTDGGEWFDQVDPDWSARVDDVLSQCIRALPSSRLLAPEDLWEINHLEELPNDSARLALREIHGAASSIGAASPAVVLRMQRRAKEVPVDVEVPDAYPAGGFDAISTRGTFENLVRTEVAYVGEGKLTDDAHAVDLFDVRFVEGELLYYTRDESPLLDQRRTVTLVIDRPGEMRHKHPRLPAQTLVLVEGVALALHEDLVRVFGPAGSQVSVVWRTPDEASRVVAAEESTLLGLTLAADVAHRRVSLMTVDEWTGVPERGRIVFSPRPPEPRLAYQLWVRVLDDTWTLGDQKFQPENFSILRTLVDDLLVPPTMRRRKG